MKRLMMMIVTGALVGAPTLASAQAKAPDPKLPNGFASNSEVWGYAIGRLLGRDTRARLADYTTVDWAALTDGFELGVYGRVLEASKNPKVGYLLGHWIGVSHRRKLMAYLPFVSGKKLAEGFTDGAQGKSRLSLALGEDAIFELQEAMIKRMPPERQKGQLERVKVARERARKKRAATQARITAGDAFRKRYLAEHKDAQTTASGLIYREITAGSGRHPLRTESVKVHYTGKLVDGSEFDSSRKRKEPAWFGVTHGVPGWVEAIQKMKVGAKWEIVLAPGLAYDHRSAGRIKPGSTLVFQVELLEIGTPPKRPPVRRAPPKQPPVRRPPPKK